ncbi:MAG: class I SAM-dependent methyltransferase [Candidatus Saganbacteria bacterium]|nr:class I SAM-dependent methyltransferase [Candidatus Saganbacteria bacterium]
MVTCKICTQQARPLFDKQYDHTYHACPACGYIFLEGSKVISPAEEKKQYQFHNNGFDNKGYVSMQQAFIDLAVLPYCPAKGRILDFGSGPIPVLAQLLRRAGFTVDIYDKFFAPEDAWQNNKYDLITVTEVFEHLPDPAIVLKSLASRLNKKGIIAVKTKFHPNDDKAFLDWWYRRDATHISFYTPRTFERLSEMFCLKLLMLNDTEVCLLGK